MQRKARVIALFAIIGLLVLPMTLTSQAKTNETYVMVSNVAAHPYWIDAKKGGEDAAAEIGVKWIYTGPADFNTPAQVTTLEQIIQTKPAGILVAALQPDALTAAINKAIAAGIPVVTVDTDAPKSSRMTYLGTDNYSAGVTMGKRMAEITNGKGKIGLASVPGQFNLEERIRGIRDAIKDYPDMSVVSIVDDKNDDSATATATVALLQAHPEITVLGSINAVGAGVASALRQTGKVGKVKAVLFDITEPIIAALEDGSVDSTLVQRTYLMTYLGVKLLYGYNHKTAYLANWDKNKIVTLPNAVDTGVMIVTKSQLAAFKNK
ncbi:MAG: substrate-binding domain-containing protein [Rectinemataceae bacterium]|jgi:ribose transport system substrate-binding protein